MTPAARPTTAATQALMNAMTATPSIDLPGWMAEQLSQASPDLLRNMIQTFAEALMSADADAVCGAGYDQRSPERSNTRNGYRRRVGTPGPGRSIWPFRSCGRTATSRSGCWRGAGGRVRP
jgi:hypothetical protein